LAREECEPVRRGRKLREAVAGRRSRRRRPSVTPDPSRSAWVWPVRTGWHDMSCGLSTILRQRKGFDIVFGKTPYSTSHPRPWHPNPTMPSPLPRPHHHRVWPIRVYAGRSFLERRKSSDLPRTRLVAPIFGSGRSGPRAIPHMNGLMVCLSLRRVPGRRALHLRATEPDSRADAARQGNPASHASLNQRKTLAGLHELIANIAGRHDMDWKRQGIA
jgi:hypothetical protein